jgi:5-formyltetrahydrofolate cyclo-ligase
MAIEHVPTSEDWNEIKAWRKARRAQLIAARISFAPEQRKRWNERITALLEAGFPVPSGAVIGFCWPYQGEFDARFAVRRWRDRGAIAALPEVIEKAHPLQFREWSPGVVMKSGVYDIPVPSETHVVVPNIAIVPMNGFDERGYRLGYGGGYFDRTLAALRGARTVIGVGYDSQAIATIHPLPHDIAMDRIVTESGFRHEAEAVELSSPACQLAEAPDAYAGYLNEAEIAAELRSLRASSDLADLAVTRALDQVLARLPGASGAQPVTAPEAPIADRLAQLRGRVRDDALHAALGEVLRLAQKAEKA